MIAKELTFRMSPNDEHLINKLCSPILNGLNVKKSSAVWEKYDLLHAKIKYIIPTGCRYLK